jgi:hypothetical protein
MNKERYNQIINEAYENYSKEYEKDNSIGMCLFVKRLDGKKTYRKPNKEMFVDLCASDKTFSEEWGLKIEERELNYEERIKLFKEKTNRSLTYTLNVRERLDENGIPTRLITVTYNDKTIESYE